MKPNVIYVHIRSQFHVLLMHLLKPKSCLLYKLVKIKNKLATYHKLIHAKIIERTHSHSSFSNYVVNIMIDRYSLNVYFIHVGPVVVFNFEKI